MVFLNEIKDLEKRRENRQLLLKALELRQKQIEQIEVWLITPQRKLKEMGKAVLMNEIPIEHYLKESEKFNLYLQKIFKKIEG